MRIVTATLMTLVWVVSPLFGQDSDQPPATPDQEQPEVLTRGPVHEGFAEPVNLDPQEGLVVPDEPPAKIQEVPPAERPQGSQYVWVPGYWAWDADRHGYIWVSACWRAAPPKMYWVPGYWAHVPEGWRWVAGFWAPTSAQKIEYLPPPPAADDVQPQGSPPLADDVWVPPCHYWYQDHYVLRPGYWLNEKPGWVWVPSHYVWTPRGYVFGEGHWDYSLDRRGVLFAPVYLPRRVYEQTGFLYSLSVVVDIGVLQVSLFTYPRYSHYCFGDYYDEAYARAGIYPRFDSAHTSKWYDPIYQYDRWQGQKSQPRWEEDERHQFDLRVANKDLRPPRTYHEMQARQAKLPEAQRTSIRMVQPLAAAIAASRGTSMKFEAMKASEQKKITQQATNVHKFREQRNQWESRAANQKTVQPAAQPKAVVTRSPEKAKPVPAAVDHKDSGAAPIRSSEGTKPAPAAVEPKDSGAAPIRSSEGAKPAPAAVEHKDSGAAPTRSSQATATPRQAQATPAPHVVQATKPESVRIPKSPVVGKPADTGGTKREAGPPPKPVAEQKNTRTPATKDAGKDKGKADKDKSR